MTNTEARIILQHKHSVDPALVQEAETALRFNAETSVRTALRNLAILGLSHDAVATELEAYHIRFNSGPYLSPR